MKRRTFLTLPAGALASLSHAADKPLRGIFPIVQTPYTASNELDLETLAKEIRFAGDIGLHGVVWPQLASEWSELTERERHAGSEAIVATARKGKVASVIGVQAPQIEAAVKYARHADRIRPDAIIALPPPGADLNTLGAYYRAIGKATDLPLFIQTVGDVSVDFVIQLSKDIPTLRFVKDEAGHTLSRISEYRRRAPELAIFTGGHGRTLLDEMSRGSSGTMPVVAFGELYVKTWELWHAGKRDQAMEYFSRAAILIHQISAYGFPGFKYLLHLRGVFPNWICRGKANDGHLDEAGRQSLQQTWEFAAKLLKS